MTKTGGAIAIERMLEATGCKTQEALAEILGVKASAISHYKKKDTVPSDWILSAIQAGASPQYLKSGEGPARTAGAGEAMAGEFPGRVPAQIPLVAAKLGRKGGFKPLPPSMNPYFFTADHLRLLSDGDPSRLLMMEFRGDHMAPEIMDGDVVLIDETETFPESYTLVAAVIEGCLSVYRVTVSPGEVIFHGTDRSRFPEVHVKREHLNSASASIEGRVVGIIRTYKRPGQSGRS